MAPARNVRPTLEKAMLKIQLPSINQKTFDPQAFLASIGQGRRILEFRKKGSIYVQGEPADAIFYLQKGKVKLTVVSQQGKEAIIGLLGTGDFFGEGCIAGQPLRMSTALAMTDCSVVRIEKKVMMQVLHQQHEFSDLFVAYLLARNIRYEEDLVDQLFNSSEKRLARILLLLARFGKEGKPEPIIPNITQETLAEMVGTTRSRVNFFMNRFRKLGFIKYNGAIEVHGSLLDVVLHD
jgi:CRP-like cAMP-binding protein